MFTPLQAFALQAAVPPPNAKMLSQYLRSHGYYTTNNYKTDYQFKAPKNAWDESGIFAHWRNRPQDKPFFSVVNFTTTHESGDTDFPIPPYLPDTPAVRRDMWKMYNNLAEADQQIGAVLAQLKQDGLLEKTVIFLYSDHGGPLPRQKPWQALELPTTCKERTLF